MGSCFDRPATPMCPYRSYQVSPRLSSSQSAELFLSSVLPLAMLLTGVVDEKPLFVSTPWLLLT
jgi:hypothetical protein